MEDKDHILVNLLQEKPEQGFRLLMDSYKQPVYWHIRRLVVLHADAQDATQETFVRVFRSVSNFRGESTFRSWLYRIATNEALRIVEKRREDMVSMDEDTTQAGRLVADEYMDTSDQLAVKLQQAIHSLPTKQQLAFNLRYYDEMSYEEMATTTGMSAANLKANYHLAKEKIIKYMNEHD